MQYAVRALDESQQIQTLVFDALDEADARVQAAARRLIPLSVARHRGLTRPADARFPLLLFGQELLALLQAGLSVIEALDTLTEKDPQASQRAVLARLAQQLREGQQLSDALRQQPAIFPPLFVGLVQAAEGTSDLPRALERYVEYETRLQAMRHKVLSAAIYPTLLLVVGTGVSLFLLGYVVPKFATVYQGTGRDLPWASQLLMSWGGFAGAHRSVLIASFVTAVVALGWWVRGAGSAGWMRALRVVPTARQKIEIFELSRLYLTLGMLLEGGIPLPQSLQLCTAVVSAARARALEGTRTSVESGSTLSESLAKHALSTPVAMRLLRVGEQSGQLGVMLTRTANFYDEETARWIERFSKAFEPVLMAAVGLVIGLIVVLLYMPVFDLAGALQ